MALVNVFMKIASAFFMPRKDSMGVFDSVKQNVTARQVAEAEYMKIGRNGMMVCPFHNDKNPSMKIDSRYYCFGCGEQGDVIDFVGKLYGLPPLESAMKIASDFGISYENQRSPPMKPMKRQLTPEQQFKKQENHTFMVLSDYLHLMKKWKTEYAPKTIEEEINPLFVEALHNIDHMEYLLDILLFGADYDKVSLVSGYGKEVDRIERRIREYTAKDHTST